MIVTDDDDADEEDEDDDVEEDEDDEDDEEDEASDGAGDGDAGRRWLREMIKQLSTRHNNTLKKKIRHNLPFLGTLRHDAPELVPLCCSTAQRLTSRIMSSTMFWVPNQKKYRCNAWSHLWCHN